jgi:hypothetical protein
MSEIFNQEFNGYEKINETFYSNPFQIKNYGKLENKFKEKDTHNSPYKININKINNQFTENSNFNFLQTNENTQKLEGKYSYTNTNSINFNQKNSYENFSSTKKTKIFHTENKENEILYSGFFGKKTEGNKINGNLKFEENFKQINPFENYLNESEIKNTSNDLNTLNILNSESNFFSNFKHCEIPDDIFNKKLFSFSIKKEDDDNNEKNNNNNIKNKNNENNKKEFNKLVKSVTISSFNDNDNNINNNKNLKSFTLNSNFNINVSKKKSTKKLFF